MDTYSVAPPSGLYEYVNTDPASPYYMWDYKLGTEAHGEQEHIYGDGRTDWVPANSPNESAGKWVAPAGATPNTIGTGGFVGEPVIHYPQSGGGSGGSTVGGANGGSGSGGTPPTNLFDTLQAQVKDLSTTLSSYGNSNTGITPAQAVEFQGEVNKLSISINSALQSQSITSAQQQQLENNITTEENIMGAETVAGIQNKVDAIEKVGTIPASDKSGVDSEINSAISAVQSASGMSTNQRQEQVEKLQLLEQQVNSLPAPPSGGGIQLPIVGGNGGGSGTSGSGQNGNGSGSGSSGNNNSGNNGDSGTASGTASGTLSSLSPSGSTSASSGSAASADNTYTVQHGDSMWAIAQAHGMTLQQLEALNPQISNPSLIYANQQINLGNASAASTDGSSSSSSTSASDTSSGSNYTVKSGDTMWGIAQAHGMTLQQLEALNPQVSNPSMIYPNQSINLGGGSSAAASSTTATTDSYNFPQTSSYQDTQSQVHTTSATLSQTGGATNGNESPDPTQNMIEAATKTNTDPLKINDEKSHLV